MLRFKRLNRWVGWAVFAIAALVYLLTIEPSTSLWDCSEFIATSYKLEVGHPPGAPLFMLLARVATMFAPSPYYVPHVVNGMNALASAFCILFLFWTITHIARRLYTRGGQEFTEAKAYAVLGAGAIGALAYTFTDTFWFSAVEGEVYALSSMFTALVVWLMLCWEEEAESNHSWRWIILIAYLMGLSIGVHILNLLTIPALVFIYYFRTAKRVTWKGLIYATLIAGAILLAINGIIIPYTVLIGMHIDIWFVNSLGLPVNTGIVVFVLLMFVALGWAVYYTHTRGRKVWNMIAVCVTMIMLGFSSYASVTIRAIANPPMNSNNPNNPAALLSVLNRDQYGNRPLIYGASYAAPIESYTEKTVYNYNPKTEKYDELTTVDKYLYPDRFMHLFPRMWNYLKKEHDYKPWAAYRTKEDFVRDEEGNIVRDESGRPQRQTVMDYGKAVRYYDGYETKTIVEPTFMENLHYFFSYQLNYMYWRYFLWNFVGRQDDIQAENVTLTHGNWLSGIDFIDQLYLGPQDNLPAEMENNRARNTYYFLPFILGLVGLIYQLNRDKRGFTIVMWLFVMMGIALVVYFNSSPGEVRERDYVYAGSFYAFSMWIGLGVLAIYDALSNLMKRNQRAAALVAVAIAAVVPGILCAENWDDHDRSGRTWARDSGHNYLNSVIQKEGVSPIIVNYGDNDTFPLWFAQEVDGLRPDIRIMNSSYLDGEWYVDEMKCKANAADGIPFSLPREKYTFVNDWIPVIDKLERAVDAKEVMEFIRSNDARTKYDIGMDEPVDFIPTKQIALPVDKDAAIASGIVKESDRDLMVDTVYINLKKSSLSRSELMLLDMFANFDWKRPIYFTQAYMLNAFGLVDYLQFDGYAYRFVPILTPLQDSWEVGRVDADYAYDVLMNKAKYGGVSNTKVYVDSFMQHNIMVARTREAFARVAKQYIFQQQYDRAEELLDRGLEVLPISQVRFTMENTYPFLEGYYSLGADEKGDALLMAYADTLIGYIEYYLQFDGFYGDLVTDIIDEKLGELSELYYLAGLADRKEVVRSFNEYYREAFGLTDEDLMNPDADTTTENSKQ
ncbi:MAG: DUF2723 domain-containing protein [Alistipes sp.]|nr:DUF2723 domain-containing protein [Alistipes sp.]